MASHWLGAWRERAAACNPGPERQSGFAQGKQRDSAHRIQVELAENDDKVDLKTIFNSMKRQGLKTKTARKLNRITDSNHQRSVAPNLLKQDFNSDAPNQKWQGDITYLRTNEGWFYLTVVIDL